MRIRKAPLLALPTLLLGLVVTGLPAFSRSGASVAAPEGFTPGRCAIEPPAELLALADWPLDKTGCASGQPATPTVVEARVRSVADILAGAADALGEAYGGRAPVVTAQIVPVGSIAREPTAHAMAVAAVESIDSAAAHSLPALQAPNAGAQGAADVLASADLQRGSRNAQRTDPGASRARLMERSEAPARVELLASAAVDADTLDNLRGGFEAPGGLQMSFGIERAVIINGVLESTTYLRVDDLGRTLGSTAAGAIPLGSAVAVIQNGVNNTVGLALPDNTFATVVQNSLDNQHLQAVTTINATVNSGELLQGLRLHQALDEALTRATMMR